MISKTMRTILHALSYGNIEVEASRRLADIKKLDAMRIFFKTLDTKVYNGNHEVPVRLYFPSEEAMSGDVVEGEKYPVLLFFHGGGWVTESIENYDRVCSRMAQSTGHIVMSVEYRLAPEYRFPIPFEDCYEAAKALYTGRLILPADPDRITIIGETDPDLSGSEQLLYRKITLQIRAGKRRKLSPYRSKNGGLSDAL